MSWNSRFTILLGFKFFLLIISTGSMTSVVKADIGSNANLIPYEWEIEPNDVLTFSFQLSVDDQNLLLAVGYRTPLTVMIRVDAVPEFRESYSYSMEEGTPSVSMSIIEFRLGKNIYSDEQLFETSPLVVNTVFDFFSSFPLALPTDFLDYATTLFINGRTERTTEDGIVSEMRVKYSATYFRVEQHLKLVYGNAASSAVFEFSRWDGVLNEYEAIDTQDFDEGYAEYLGLTPGMHVIKTRIERVQTQNPGYVHSPTPGFAFLLAILSFCLYGILKKRKESSENHCKS
ncbi:MAG: hypothetical protein ACXACI_15750 [Candidatus Hodarchaeales archaeon]